MLKDQEVLAKANPITPCQFPEEEVVCTMAEQEMPPHRPLLLVASLGKDRNSAVVIAVVDH